MSNTPTGETAGAAGLEPQMSNDHPYDYPVYGTDAWASCRGYELATSYFNTHEGQMQQADDIAATLRDLRDSLTANAQHEQDRQRIEQLERENKRLRDWCESAPSPVFVDGLAASIERARTYTGVEGYPCPLCRYEDGVFIEPCEMHRQIDALAAEVERLRAERESDHIGMGMLYGDINNLRRELAAALSWITQHAAQPPSVQPVDWSNAPEWAGWWAMDETGFCQWHELEPQPTGQYATGAGYWLSWGYTTSAPCPDDDSGIDWRATLQRRPTPATAQESSEVARGA